MSLLTKLSGTGIKFLKKGVSSFGGNAKVIKTTSQTVGSMIPEIAGGKTVSNAVRSGVTEVFGNTKAGASRITDMTKKLLGGSVGTNAKKGLAKTLKWGIPVTGGLLAVNSVKNVFAKDGDLRKQEMQQDIYQDYLDMGAEAGVDPGQILSGIFGEGTTGGNSSIPSYNQTLGSSDNNGSSGSSLPLILLGGAGLIGALYFIGKKSKKSKK